MCFYFLYKFVWNIFCYENNWARFDQKLVLMWSTSHSSQILMKFELSRLFFKYVNIKFSENRLGGSRAVPYGQTDIPIVLTNKNKSFQNVLKVKIKLSST